MSSPERWQSLSCKGCWGEVCDTPLPCCDRLRVETHLCLFAVTGIQFDSPVSVCCDWLSVCRTWVYRRTSWSRFRTCCLMMGGSVSYLMHRARDTRAPVDTVHAGQAVGQVAAHHSNMMSTEMSVVVWHPTWQTLMLSVLLMLLRQRQPTVVYTILSLCNSCSVSFIGSMSP